MLRQDDRLRPFARRDSCMLFAMMLLCALPGPAAIAQANRPQEMKPAPSRRTEARRAVSVETRPQLFATLCALDAAGFDSNVSTTTQSPGRVKLREQMLALKGPAQASVHKVSRAQGSGS